MRRLLVISLVPVLVGASACGGRDVDPGFTGDSPAPSRSASPSPSVTPSSPSAGGTRAAVCDEVRAGIDAFNTGAFEETIAHFRTAVPLARRDADRDPSRDSRLLLRAVRYYAELPAAEYPAASAGSADFQRWKAVTLGLCVASDDQLSPPPSPSPSESGLQA